MSPLITTSIYDGYAALVAVYDGTNVKIHVDGTEELINAAAVQVGTAGFALGVKRITGGSYYSGADLGGVIAMPRVATTGEIATINTALRSMAGLS